MKTRRDYFILFPIVLVFILSCCGGYVFLEKIQTLEDLKKTVSEQILLKNVVRSLMKERAALDSANINKQDLVYLRERTDDDIAALMNEKKDDSMSSLSSQISTIRENIDDNEQFSNVFFSFYNHINSSIIESYSRYINDPRLNYEIKSYITAINSVYGSINSVNLDREYIAQAIINKEAVTKKTLRRWVGNLYFSSADIAFLPSEDSKKRILDFMEASESLSVLNSFKDEHFDMLEARSDYVSKENLLKIDNFKRDKFLFLLEISNLLESELSIENKHYVQIFQMYLLMFILSIALSIAVFYKIFNNIKLFSSFESAVNAMKIQINASDKEQTVYETLKDFTRLYQELKLSFDYLDEFNDTKNMYLEKIAKRHKSNLLNKFQSIIFLRQNLSSVEQLKALNIIEESQSRLAIDFNNIEKLVQFENRNISVRNSTFDTQEIFKIALESRLDEIREKQISYITFVDPDIKNEVAGDKNKIISIISNILSCSVYQCNQYAKVVVQIKKSEQTSNTDILTVDVSIRNNADFIEKCDIYEDDMQKTPTIRDEYVSFWLAVSDIHLKSIGSRLEIKGSKDTGNEFAFSLLLKTQDSEKLNTVTNKKELNIAYINDTDDDYNEFFAKTMKGLDIDFIRYQNLKKLSNPEQYDIVFVRSNKDSTSGIKNLINLKDPLTPIKIMQYIQNNINFEDTNKFMLNKPQILILEDNPLSLNLIKYAFERYNVDITSINEYRNIFEIIKKKSYDIVFMDTGILGNNVLDMAKKYKNSDVSKHTPVVAMVSNTSHLSSQQALEIFDECIKKPFSKKELNRVLTSFMPNIDLFVKSDSLYNKSQNILILKKTSIENKIFSGVLAEFTNYLTVSNNIDEFMYDLKTTAYGIVLIDDSVKFFESQRVIEAIEEARMKYGTNTKLFIFSNKPQSSFNIKQYIKILSPQISKEQLADIVKQEMYTNKID